MTSTYTRTYTDTEKVPRTENDAAIEAGVLASEPHLLEPGKVYGWMTTTGKVETIDLTGDAYRDQPRRKTGTTVVQDVESFGQYWDKHADGDFAEVYANVDNDLIVAVLDAHGSTTPGWRDHRLTYGLRRTREWQTWANVSGKLLSQVEFAELLEANLHSIAQPDAAELLELAQTFTAKTEVNFKSGNLLASGARELTYSEDVEASGGRGTKKIEIPKEITLAIAPYEGSSLAAVTARFRYRISEGTLRLGVVLDGMDEVVAEAFNEVVEHVEARIGATVMRGRPA
jgi:uncharacterized protein YfdQ (DUF2303 family)